MTFWTLQDKDGYHVEINADLVTCITFRKDKVAKIYFVDGSHIEVDDKSASMFANNFKRRIIP